MKILGILLHDKTHVTAALLDTVTESGDFVCLEVDKSFPAALESFVEQLAGGQEVLVGLELYGTPVDVFPGFMHFLQGVSKLAAAGIALSEDKKRALISDIPDAMKWAAHGQKETRLIFPGMARAFFSFENDRDPTERECAASIARICGSIGKYRYCRSVGVVQSGGDVASFLEHPPENGSFVLSGSDWYQMVPTAATRVGAQRGDVFLTYELGKRQYEYLLEHNALKMGLLHTCREFSIDLYCGALEGEEGEVLEKLMDVGVRAFTGEHLVWGER